MKRTRLAKRRKGNEYASPLIRQNIMAKKTKKTSEAVTLTSKDKKTLGSIRGLADGVVQSAERGRAPYVEIPSRSLSNVRFNQSKRIIEMGGGANRRELFNLGQARSYMQTLLVGSGCKQDRKSVV